MVLIQADLCPESPGRTVPPPLLCRPWGLPAPVLLGYIVASLSGWVGPGYTLSSGMDDSALLPRLVGGKCVFACVWGRGGRGEEGNSLQGQKFTWGPEWDRPEPHWVPWSNYTTLVAVRISKASGWDCYLGFVGRTLVCQQLSSGCSKPQPPSVTIWFPVDKPGRFPCADSTEIVVMQDHGGSPKKGPTCSLPTLGSLVLLEEPQAQERPLSVVRCRPGKASVWLTGASLSYPSAAPLSSRIFSVVSCSWVVC